MTRSKRLQVEAGDSGGTHSRPPLERMLLIHKAIQSGSYPNASQLAAQLDVSTKSIQRDLMFMRDRLGLPIAYEASRFGFIYTESVSSFPSFQVTEGELFALLAAEKALQQYRGTPFEKALVSAFKKISQSLPDTVSINWADWDATLSFRTTAEPILDLQVLDLLARAAAQKQQLLLSYRKPGGKHAEDRVVDPYHLANVNGEWFLFAYCHLRKSIRTFVPTRMRSVKLTGARFQRPHGFSLEAELKNSFGILSGDKEFLVRIRFSGAVSDYIREKRWHPSQKLTELKDGGVQISLKLSSLVEVQRWVLAWGGNAVPLSPPELVRGVRAAARLLLKSCAG